ncbi:MAG TPA: NmrA family NAD(P)-binding protein [Polyangiales bacterium]|nr:NmrA family NAD(P)-binding protein [Polyangiales bacterium]
MYVVTGATGNTGSIVAKRLLASGKRVRLIVRKPEKVSALAAQGAEVVIADLNDQTALTEALRGADGLYYLSPPDPTSESFLAERKQLTERIAGSIARAGVKHVVLLSSIGADQAEGTGPIISTRNAELQLRAAGVPSTFVRAAYFIENWATVLPAAKQDGVLPAFFPADLRIPMVATRDIGEVAAQALLDGPRGVRVIELSGPEDPSPNDVARSVSQLLGRSVSVAEAPLEAVVPTFKNLGCSSDFAELYRELFACIRSGRLAWEGRGETIRGTTTVAAALEPLLR